MNNLSKQRLIGLFNSNFKKMVKKIRYDTPKKSDNERVLHNTLDLIDEAMSANYKIIIEHFYLYVYSNYKDRIIRKDEDFMTVKNFKRLINNDMILKYLIPIISVYNDSKKEQKDIIYNYMNKFVKVCDHYKKYM